MIHTHTRTDARTHLLLFQLLLPLPLLRRLAGLVSLLPLVLYTRQFGLVPLKRPPGLPDQLARLHQGEGVAGEGWWVRGAVRCGA